MLVCDLCKQKISGDSYVKYVFPKMINHGKIEQWYDAMDICQGCSISCAKSCGIVVTEVKNEKETT